MGPYFLRIENKKCVHLNRPKKQTKGTQQNKNNDLEVFGMGHICFSKTNTNAWLIRFNECITWWSWWKYSEKKNFFFSFSLVEDCKGNSIELVRILSLFYLNASNVDWYLNIILGNGKEGDIEEKTPFLHSDWLTQRSMSWSEQEKTINELKRWREPNMKNVNIKFNWIHSQAAAILIDSGFVYLKMKISKVNKRWMPYGCTVTLLQIYMACGGWNDFFFHWISNPLFSNGEPFSITFGEC